MSTTKTLKSAAEAVKQHRKALLELRSAVGTLEQLITEHEIALGSLESTEETQALGYASLQREREDVLADIALHRKSSTDLDEIDRRISEATRLAGASGNPKTAAELLRIEQGLEGLRRRKAAVEQKLSALEQESPNVIRQFLLAEATCAYDSYLQNAERTIADMKRIAALDSVYQTLTGDKTRPFRRYHWIDAMLPVFEIPYDGEIRAQDRKGGLLWTAGFFNSSNGFDEAIAEERERLSPSGVFDLS